jgi:UDP-3-O-[3-hydroxymyristoyl] glucosamine N-acyltransferase
MGGQVGVADHCHIGTQVRLGGKAGVMSSLHEPGIYHDTPAQPEKDAIKNHVNISRIPQMREQLKQLTAQVADLHAQLARLSEPSRPRAAA